MPERILREGILESDAVNRLSPEAELFYRRIMSVVDDYGRFEWDVKKIRLRVFGYRFDWATEEKIRGWMRECEKELVLVYRVGKKEYFEILNFRQRLRASKSKFPAPGPPTDDEDHVRRVSGRRQAIDRQKQLQGWPEDETEEAEVEKSTASKENARHVPGNCHADDRHVRSETESEANAETESEASRECSGSEQGLASASPPPPNDPTRAKANPPIESRAASHGPPGKPQLRVETKPIGTTGMVRPTRIEIPPGLPPEHAALAKELRDATDGRMEPAMPDDELVSFLLAEAAAAGMTPQAVIELVETSVRRMRKSNSRWRPDSWGWFRMVLPSKMRTYSRSESMMTS